MACYNDSIIKVEQPPERGIIMGILNFLLGNPSDKAVAAYAMVLYEEVEDSLDENMADVKYRAIAGDSDAQYEMGRYYYELYHGISNATIGAANKDTKAFYYAHREAYYYFIGEAVNQGHSAAKAYRQKNRDFKKGRYSKCQKKTQNTHYSPSISC
jgi:hypothetical protein